MQKLLLLSWLLICSFSVSAQAAVYFEPKVGVGSAGVDYNDGASSSTSTGISNFNAGGIIGSAREDLYFGLDLRYDNLGNYDGNNNSLNFLSLGLGLGYTFTYVPIRWTFTLDLQQRAWTNDFNNMIESGGWRTGFGYFMAKNVLVNFEYSEPYYSNEDNGVKFLPRIYTVSLSFPMEFDSPSEPWKERRGYKKKQDINSDDFGATEAAEDMNEKFNDIAPVPGADAAAGSALKDEFEIEDSPTTAEIQLAPETFENESLEETGTEGLEEDLNLDDDFNLDDEF